MSSAETGKSVVLTVALSGGTVVAFAAEKSFSINREAGSIATDAKGDLSVTNTPGRQNVTCSVECLYVHTDASQQRLITQMKANSQVVIEMQRYDGSGYAAFESASATITSLNIVHADLEAATFSAEFDIDGDFTSA